MTGITRISGHRGDGGRPNIAAPLPTTGAHFARHLEAKRGRQPSELQGRRPESDGNRASLNQPAPNHTTQTRANRSRAQRSASTSSPLNQTSLRAPPVSIAPASSQMVVTRAAAQLVPQVLAHARMARRAPAFGLIEETIVSIEGLGDIAVSLYRFATGWVVRVDAASLIGRLAAARR